MGICPREVSCECLGEDHDLILVVAKMYHDEQ